MDAAARWVIPLVALALYWIGNGSTSLWDRDEPRYAESARVMFSTGDVVTPYFNDTFRFQKPILTYWLIALAYSVLGESEFAARFWSGLAVAGCAILTGKMGDRYFGRLVGLIASALFAVSPLVISLGKLCIPDGLQLLWSTVTLACLADLFRLDGRPPRPWATLVGWIALGLAILTKGPIVPAMVVCALAAYIALARPLLDAIRPRWGIGLVALSAVTLPWLLAIGWTVGLEFFQESLGRQIGGRAVHSFDGKWLPPGYYAVSFLLGMAPWAPLAILAALRDVRSLRTPGPRSFLVAWIVGPMFLLECFPSKQMHYLAPVYPALALLSAAELVRLAKTGRNTMSGWDRLAIGTTAFAALVMPVGLAVISFLGPDSTRAATFLVVAIAFVVVALAVRWLLKQSVLPGAMTLAGATAAVVFFLCGCVLPAMESGRLIPRLAKRAVDVSQSERVPLVLHQLIEPGLVYYGRRAMPDAFEPEDLERTVRFSDVGVLTLASEKQMTRLRRSFSSTLEVVETWNGWVKMHPDRVYLVHLKPETAELAGHLPIRQ